MRKSHRLPEIIADELWRYGAKSFAWTYAEAFEWFREKGYCVSIRRIARWTEYNYFIYPPNSDEHLEDNILEEYDSWEEAENAALLHLIRILQQQYATTHQ